MWITEFCTQPTPRAFSNQLLVDSWSRIWSSIFSYLVFAILSNSCLQRFWHAKLLGTNLRAIRITANVLRVLWTTNCWKLYRIQSNEWNITVKKHTVDNKNLVFSTIQTQIGLGNNNHQRTKNRLLEGIPVAIDPSSHPNEQQVLDIQHRTKVNDKRPSNIKHPKRQETIQVNK